MTHDDHASIDQIVERFGRDPERLMDIVRAVHARLGHLSEDAVGRVARACGVKRVQVRDQATFYAFFSSRPRGRHVVRVCNAVIERMMGADAVGAAFEEHLGITFGETTPDGEITLEHTPCIGLSDQAPSALVDTTPLTNIKPGDVPAIIKAIREDKVAQLSQAKVEPNLHLSGNVIFAPMERGAAVRQAVNKTPREVIDEINQARVRGRGGAGFPTAMKWDFCSKAPGTHYLICNGDEGEPGTFKDRVILTQQPDLLFEGMTVAGYALEAREGIFYLRGEYEWMLPALEQVLARRRTLGLLGEHICGKEAFNFDIRIQLGAGAYICGEESALIESLEGKRGAPRDRPPFPVQKGFRNEPTAVNNVETLCCTARILEKGGKWFQDYGTRDSTGTKLLSVSGDCDRPGVYEVEYGITVEHVLEMVGSHNPQAVQIGGPSGQCLAPKDFGRAISFEDLPTGGSFMIFGPDRDLLELMRQFTEFFAEESCGWCAPCRAGTTLLLKMMDRIVDGQATRENLGELERLANTVKAMSRCGLGQTAANPILSTLKNFHKLYDQRLCAEQYTPAFDLAAAVKAGCDAANRPMPTEEQHA